MTTTPNWASFSCCLAFTLLLGGGVARAGELQPMLEQSRDTLEPPDSMEVQAQRRLLEKLESEYGAYGAGLPEQLLGLGQALQRAGRHEEAVAVFKRGVHLTRINEGLYSAAQIPLINGEISSHIALGQLAAADDRQRYLYQVQIRSLDSGERRAQALMQQAAWQYDAYRLGLGQVNYARLMSMWDLYRVALTDIAERQGDASRQLLKPLYGMLRAQYLIAEHEMSAAESNADGDYGTRQQYNRFNAYRSQGFKKGSAVIRAIYEVEKQQPTYNAPDAARALAQLGDWYLWHGEYEDAHQAYLDAQMELVEHDAAQEELTQLFGSPRALPAVDGLDFLPPRVAVDDGNVVLSFGVTARGRVVDLERVATVDGIDGKINRLMRKLRKTPFRPRYEHGEPVDTEDVVRAYVIAEE